MIDHDSKITVVSGLPRSGTSLMMQMLVAGGMEPLTDNVRQPDENNLKGYYELEQVKGLARDASWVPQARGKAVKVIAQLLRYLPETEHYHVLFMDREIEEVLDSQKRMITNLQGKTSSINPDLLCSTFKKQRDQAWSYIASHKQFHGMRVPYSRLVQRDPVLLEQLFEFLKLDHHAAQEMAAVIDTTLYRSKKGST